MAVPTRADLHRAWTTRSRQRLVGATDLVHRSAVRLLADGAPVGPGALAAAAGIGEAEAADWLSAVGAAGYELDGHGRLVGAALTLRPTPHRFRVRGRELHAWCGFDTIFLPILLDEVAQVSSTCPVTGTAIELEVAADGTVVTAEPPDAVVSIVGPDITADCASTGPASPVCRQMPLLASPDAGQVWLAAHPGVAVLDLAGASWLARDYTSA